MSINPTSQSLQELFAPSPSQNWSRRAYHSSAVVGNYVYIDMGEIAVGNAPLSGNVVNPKYAPYPVNCTLSFPLHSWNNATNVNFSAIIKPAAPTYNVASLWHDESENSLYSFGGDESWLDKTPLDLAVWKFQPNSGGGGAWSKNTTYSSSPWAGAPGITRPAGGAYTYTNKTAFYLGGYTSDHTSPQTQNQLGFVPTPGLVTYSFDNGSWTNSTAGFNNLGGEGSWEWGGMEYIPTFGPNGIVVMWGGETSNTTSYVFGAQLRTMNEITLLDPVTQQWYTQNVTGTVPSPRSRFCSMHVADSRPISTANNTGTHEIYMYAGFNGVLGAGNEVYDEIWALSLPAFSWQRVDDSQKNGRYGHTCHLVGNRQMLSIGGGDSAQTDSWSTPDYIHPQGLGVFDLTAAKWTSGFNAAAAPYQRPKVVQDHYDQNGLYPSTWSQVALENLFLHPGASSTNSSSSAASSSIAAPSHSVSNTRGATIAGATIAGLVVAIMPFILVFWFFRCRHARPNSIVEMHGEDIKHEMYAGAHTREPSAYGAHRSNYGRGRSRGRSRGRFVVELDAGGRTPRRSHTSYQTEWIDEKKVVREEVRDLGTQSPELLRPYPAAWLPEERRSPGDFGSPDSVSPETVSPEGEEWTSEKPWDEKYLEARLHR